MMQKKIFLILPLPVILVLLNLPFMFGGMVVGGNVTVEFIFMDAGIFALFSIVAFLRNRIARLYIFLALLSISLSFVFLISNEFRFTLFFAASSLIALRFFFMTKGRSDFSVGAVSFTVLAVLLLLSTSLRFLPINTISSSTGYVFSIYDNAAPAGVPFTYSFGLVFSLGDFSLTVSPITAILFPLIAYLTADNTFLIIGRYRSNGASSLAAIAVTAIACQCENTIGIISATVTSSVLSALPYFIFLSAGLLLLTNFYLRHPRRIRFPEINGIVILAVLIPILTTEFAIVYSGMIYDLAAFGFNSFLSLLSGFLLGLIFPFKRTVPLYSVFIAFAIQTVLFLPFPIAEALSSPLFFEIYTLSGMVSGLIVSLSFRNRERISRISLFEFVFSMETMIAALLLYLSLYSFPIFSGYSEIAVIDFSVFILVVSVPAMWLSNVYLLSVRAFGS